MERQPSVQSPLQKWNFGTSGHKLHKNLHQNFMVLSNFVYFFNLSNCIILGIGCRNKSMLIIWPIVFQTSIFDHLQILSQVFDTNIKQMKCKKIPHLTVLYGDYFVCLVWVENWHYKTFQFGWSGLFLYVASLSHNRA